MSDSVAQPLGRAFRQSISVKVITISVLALVVALAAIGYTLLLSWQLEGGAAAINDAGSLRMRAFRLAIALEHGAKNQLDDPAQEIRALEATLTALQHGDPRRPLFLPDKPAIRQQFQAVVFTWQHKLKPLLEQHSDRPPPLLAAEYRAQVGAFFDQIQLLVKSIEEDNAQKITLLRSFQLLLVGMAMVGTVVMIYLLYLFIIRPVQQLRRGQEQLAQKNFAVRLPVESQDELGQLTAGFNQMATELQSVYEHLEERVTQKTALLARQNRELTTLYELTAWLNQGHALQDLGQGFVARIKTRFHAEAVSLRLLDLGQDQLYLQFHEGLPNTLQETERCIKRGSCLCGAALEQQTVLLQDFRRVPSGENKELPCATHGYAAVVAVPVMARQESLGSLSLHLSDSHAVGPEDMQLLTTLCQHLGQTLWQERLAAQSRELAVVQERNLVAQNLHDSIAQGLTFLNLQIQLLQDSLARQAEAEVQELLPLIQAGVQESYEDVRELLLNFRARLPDAGLQAAMQLSLQKFQQQTGIQVQAQLQDLGPAYSPEEEIQLLFVLQESLSNVRKHSGASRVEVNFQRARDMCLTVRDNGCGFTLPEPTAGPTRHVGLSIMQERAQRLQAELQLSSTLGEGTCVTLRRNEQTLSA